MTLDEVLTLAVDESDGAADRFTGQSPDDGWPRIFGGLVVAQSLMAAYATVEGRNCHSMHCYFLRAGDTAEPIGYEVERTRDGGAFCVRRVSAVQHGRPIFVMMASFQKVESGPDHQYPMPPETPPEGLVDEMQRWLALGDALPDAARALASRPQRIEMRRAGPPAFEPTGDKAPHKTVWMRAKLPVGPSVARQQATLAYASDMTFLSTALGAHGLGFWSKGLQAASLDHSVWFHRPANFDDWHLFVQESPSTSGARGLVQGRMYSRDGVLVASLAQEGLMRPRP